ncbi:hypothetical protein [Hydrogenophaga sp. 2FB]|uniref:hypothetical protein n=1 Tax=Hydrogenophaga sp. 2FB TaxID=2502187 RepID=UPI0010F55808|nr:hypothetical protein [Hydrogenophaga sp. 2FB]
METKEFEVLLGACAEVAELFPEGVIYIGGIAVYLHAKNVATTSELAEFTHDADFYISFADMGDLRDIEEVTPNRRLSKHQMIKKGFEFDIYTERQSSLIVPYDMVLSSSDVYGGMRVASLEHLLVLKLMAFMDRKGSSKGDKDAKDLLRIAAVASQGGNGFRPELALPYLQDEHLALLKQVAGGPHALSLAQGNAMLAKRIRADFTSVVTSLTTPPEAEAGKPAVKRSRKP